MRKLRKLTETEYFKIQDQYDKTPAPDEGYSMATGEHWILKAILDRMGFYTTDTLAAYYLAGTLVSKDYIHDEQIDLRDYS